jgi:hypothetical protein
VDQLALMEIHQVMQLMQSSLVEIHQVMHQLLIRLIYAQT